MRRGRSRSSRLPRNRQAGFDGSAKPNIMSIIGRKIRERAYPYPSNPALVLPDLRAVRSTPIDTVISLFLSEPPVAVRHSPGSGSAPDTSANAGFCARPLPAVLAIRGPVTPLGKPRFLVHFVPPRNGVFRSGIITPQPRRAFGPRSLRRSRRTPVRRQPRISCLSRLSSP